MLSSSVFPKKVQVAHTRLPSVGLRSRSRFLAVSLQVTRVINLAAGCHYFPPGPQLPLQPLRGLLPILLVGEHRYEGVNSLRKTVTRQHHGCDLKPGPSAPESSTLSTWLPSHPSLFLHEGNISAYFSHMHIRLTVFEQTTRPEVESGVRFTSTLCHDVTVKCCDCKMLRLT